MREKRWMDVAGGERLALHEALLALDDGEACVAAVRQWLAARGLADAAVHLVDEHGLPDAALVPALAATGPVTVGERLAAPLRVAAGWPAIGILSAAPGEAALLALAARALGDRLVALGAQRVRTDLLARFSHELRTPLNAIVGYTAMLLEGVPGPLTPKQRDGLERVASNGRHLLGLINGILDLGRIETGRMPLVRRRVPLRALVEEILADLAPLHAGSGLTLATEVADGLIVETDRQKLKQILVNLVGNALKFTAAGWVRVSGRREGDAIVVEVADSGPGLAPADHARVFDELERLDRPAARGARGAGLGLPISRRLAGLLGGGLTVDSHPEGGALFRVILPG